MHPYFIKSKGMTELWMAIFGEHGSEKCTGVCDVQHVRFSRMLLVWVGDLCHRHLLRDALKRQCIGFVLVKHGKIVSN